jgi:xanthosine utilization system XapX-like protein
MKTSAKLAWKSMLSYFLANLGMLIVMVILAGIIAIPVLVVVWVTLAPFTDATMTALANWATANPLLLGGLGVLVLIPVVSLFMVVSGSIYGMSHELVTKGETKAEHAFSYLRHKFLSFAGTGAVITIIVIVPPVIAWGLTSYAMGYAITAPVTYLLTAFTFVWVYFTAGLTSLVFPAVASGKGVQDAFKESFSLSRQYFDRVYGVLTAIVLLLAATFGPIIIAALAMVPFVPPVTIALVPFAGVLVYTVVMVFLWLLLFLPMVRISWVKIYQELTGGEIATQSVVDMPIV